MVIRLSPVIHKYYSYHLDTLELKKSEKSSVCVIRLDDIFTMDEQVVFLLVPVTIFCTQRKQIDAKIVYARGVINWNT